MWGRRLSVRKLISWFSSTNIKTERKFRKYIELYVVSPEDIDAEVESVFVSVMPINEAMIFPKLSVIEVATRIVVARIVETCPSEVIVSGPTTKCLNASGVIILVSTTRSLCASIYGVWKLDDNYFEMLNLYK